VGGIEVGWPWRITDENIEYNTNYRGFGCNFENRAILHHRPFTRFIPLPRADHVQYFCLIPQYTILDITVCSSSIVTSLIRFANVTCALPVCTYLLRATSMCTSVVFQASPSTMSTSNAPDVSLLHSTLPLEANSSAYVYM
jgi:hypothetical protein